MEPTLAGFQQFLISVVGISTALLASSSPIIAYAYNIAIVTVNCDLQCTSFIDPFTGQTSSLYAIAVYNYAAANVLFFAQDAEGAPIVPGSVSTQNPNGLPFFANIRSKYNLNGYVSGTISASSDESTANSMVVPDAAQGFTMEDLQLAKSPYGRIYLGIAQKAGPSLFGLS